MSGNIVLSVKPAEGARAWWITKNRRKTWWHIQQLSDGTFALENRDPMSVIDQGQLFVTTFPTQQSAVHFVWQNYIRKRNQ